MTHFYINLQSYLSTFPREQVRSLLFQEESRQKSNWLPDLVVMRTRFKYPVGEDANWRHEVHSGPLQHDRLLPVKLPFPCAL